MAPIAVRDIIDGADVMASESITIKEKVVGVKGTSIRQRPSAPCLVTDFIRYQVESEPEAVAVHYEDEEPYTYSQLWQLVEQIRATGNFAPGQIVPVCMDLSVEFVATLLAIMVSGAAYLVLDPEGSPERNRVIAADCGARTVVVHEKHRPLFDQATSVENLLSKTRTSNASSPLATNPSDLAYLIYTSGSTGTPKGVLLSHRAASHGIDQFELNGRRRWLLFYNPVFSAAQRTILATLAKGACLCLARRDRLATALPEVLSNLQVDALGITPSALALLSTEEVSNSLQQVTTVGEPLSQNLVDLWADRVHLRVSYGLSECAQLNFSRQLKRGDNPRNPGRPADTTSAVILEPGTGRELPAGEPGELCLSGPQVANGYYQRIKETNAAFVKNLLGRDILFRTGDQAVRLPDGSFEILGRIDHQIKIHGQRVEPQEVAQNLATVAGVAALACVGSYINEKSSLVAAVIPAPESDWESLVQSLRGHAQRSFPPYMVPSYWLQCDEFPVNRNGKVDFKAIRNLAESTDVSDLLGRCRSVDGEAHVFSEVALEIVEVWADVLHLSPSFILPTDSFVSLGGTSIDAIKANRELRGQGIHIELADMLQSQTVEEVADASRIGSKDAGQPSPLAPFSLLSDESLKTDLLADRGVADAFPTTALQEGILASTIQGNPDYLYQRVFDVRHLDLVRLKLAFQVIFWRSENLQSSFVSATQGFVQVTRNNFDLPWTELSISLDKYLEADKRAGVTLGQPFMRVAVIDKSILVVSVHHALFDFWSHGFMFDDVARVYSGKRSVHRAHWKSFVGLVHNQDRGKSEQFWRQHLAEVSPTILNHSPELDSFTVVRSLPLDLKSVAAALQVPSSAIFYGAWALVLSLHTASKSVVMATAISGRELPLPGIEAIDGPTLAMVPQAVLVNPDQSLLDLVRSVNVNLWSIIKHSQYGMRGAFTAAGHQPSTFLDTMVNILVREEGKNELTGEVFQIFGPRSAWRTEYTTLNIGEGDEGFELSLTSPMEPRRLEFILNQFCHAVETIVHDPRLSVRSLNLIDSTELDFLLQWNDNQPDEATLHGQFEAIAHQYPSRTAINFQNKQFLSYAELNKRADRMANFLSERGVTPGDIVPLLLEKSPIMIITILALFKIGAAYVPLSPENPLDRNGFIARDVGAKVILTESEHASYFAGEDIPSVLVDQARLCAYSTDKQLVNVSPDNLAYILYTSGSTGQPKGVTISHGACAAAMRSIIEFEGKQGKPFRALQFSNYVFDVSLYDFFVTLHSGGTLCIAPSEQLLGDLAGAINDMGVNHVFLTPTVARLLSPEDVPGLESMTVGGEQLTRDVVTTWASRLTLRNGYGPTEASVLVTMKEVDTQTTGGNIGKPLASVGAVILEADGVRPVPYGAVGELCFWGPQLSQGYFKKPELTAGAFIDSDIGGGRRLYRSGDLARYLPGGDIECLGRKDDQVKVNGHRIELGEIEQAFLRTGDVTDCILTVWKHNTTAHLVASVVFEPIDEDLRVLPLDRFADDAQRLKSNLSGLAHYMVPKFILPLPFLPRLPSGKADRKQLKARVQSMSQAELSQFSFDKVGLSESEEIIPLVSETQRSLQQGWIEVLQLPDDQFGLEANFLSLGGDSISAINLVSWLRRRHLNATVRDVLRYPLLGSMAEQLQQESEDEKASQAVVFSPSTELISTITSHGLQQEQYEYIYPCPPGQAEFLTQGARPETFWRLMAVRALGKNTEQVTQWVDLVKQLTQTNEILRTTFTRFQETWYGVVLRDSTPTVEFFDVANADERKEIIDAAWEDKFGFGKPFIRYAILRHGDGTHEVVTKLDHGLYDGTLLRVFDAHFQAYQRQEALQPFTSFKEFAFHIWQINQKRPTLDFWTQPDKRPIHFSYPSNNVQIQSRIDASVVHMINLDFDSFSRSRGVTVSIMFQAIFQLWLAFRSKQQDVSFDYLYTGRNVDLPDPNGINGTCANFLPMRSRVDAQDSVQDFLLRTQDEFWQYTENNTVGVEDICRACGISREESANRALFLFQPFEPAGAPEQYQRWVIMAKSAVTMPQPYAVVFEVIKTADPNAYKLKFAYDQSVWTSEEVKEEARVVERMLSTVVEKSDARIDDILRL
ncbi:acetyl-CoA synthetase-like protein [Aspergillus heteromorphus CBS 117.55]|uniref:Acetyl-CoA synthetase-like protein n=1 Tax=Aspergillus heteromorphus CBS 117.55 TaxID=1448321 RepID=A0A317WF92_9EURO|nr:acetyl-CoA synthetase-like protein [Aspergillus heteromorphus CBS 117.55]PWY85083.1 acetyl-CoA synthetase-like protein [Aspergillus heteromorphus CBS 117.55]